MAIYICQHDTVHTHEHSTFYSEKWVSHLNVKKIREMKRANYSFELTLYCTVCTLYIHYYCKQMQTKFGYMLVHLHGSSLVKWIFQWNYRSERIESRCCVWLKIDFVWKNTLKSNKKQTTANVLFAFTQTQALSRTAKKHTHIYRVCVRCDAKHI